MVESTALEMRRTGNCTEGSNPSLSAKYLAYPSPYQPFNHFAHEKAHEGWPIAGEQLRTLAVANQALVVKNNGNQLQNARVLWRLTAQENLRPNRQGLCATAVYPIAI